MKKVLVVFLTVIFAWFCSAALIQGLASYIGIQSGDIGVFIITVFMSTSASCVFGFMVDNTYD